MLADISGKQAKLDEPGKYKKVWMEILSLSWNLKEQV